MLNLQSKIRYPKSILLPLGMKGLNEWMDLNGKGFWFSFSDESGKLWNRLFPNIGQPNQYPPVNPLHVDDLTVRDVSVKYDP
ncbi:MAG TPA: hypothetical protein DD381_13535, partial [Lentisphaeria bacterium]|nr:hypothetical protein [Lentisphaeria bacterium]